MQAWTGRKRQHRASPSNFRALFRASFGCRVGSGDAAEPNGLRPYLGLVDSDSNFVVTEPVIVPKGTLTFQVGEVSTTTTIVISCTLSVPLAGGKSYLVRTGDSEIGLTLTTVVLMDEARIFIFSVGVSVVRSTPMRLH